VPLAEKSPKSHCHWLIVPLETFDWSVKQAFSGTQPLRLAPVNMTTGIGLTVTRTEELDDGVLHPSVNITVYVVVIPGVSEYGPAPLPRFGVHV
jgi:hypothetical protein